MQPERGDVVRSRKPFKLGSEKQRPWLIVSDQKHPFSEEQYLAVAISTEEYDHSIALRPAVWERGGVPRGPLPLRGRYTLRVVRTSLRGKAVSPRTAPSVSWT